MDLPVSKENLKTLVDERATTEKRLFPNRLSDEEFKILRESDKYINYTAEEFANIKELKNKSEENLEKLKIDANQNQGHISAKELISCQSHGPDAIKELNESFVMYPKDVIRNGGKKLEIAKSLFPELADIIENGITLPDELFTNKHS